VFLLLEVGYTTLLPMISDLVRIWTGVSGKVIMLDDTIFIQYINL